MIHGLSCSTACELLAVSCLGRQISFYHQGNPGVFLSIQSLISFWLKAKSFSLILSNSFSKLFCVYMSVVFLNEKSIPNKHTITKINMEHLNYPFINPRPESSLNP